MEAEVLKQGSTATQRKAQLMLANSPLRTTVRLSPVKFLA